MDIPTQRVAEFVDGLRHALALLRVEGVSFETPDDEVIARLRAIDRVTVAASRLKHELAAPGSAA